MIICSCTGVTDATIDGLIEEGLCTVSQIATRCGAGRCCAPCREEIARMLALSRAAARPERAPSQPMNESQ